MRSAAAVAAMILVLVSAELAAAPKPNPYVPDKPAARAKPTPTTSPKSTFLDDKYKAVINASPRRRENPYVATRKTPKQRAE